jgi:hypothetical protein
LKNGICLIYFKNIHFFLIKLATEFQPTGRNISIVSDIFHEEHSLRNVDFSSLKDDKFGVSKGKSFDDFVGSWLAAINGW